MKKPLCGFLFDDLTFCNNIWESLNLKLSFQIFVSLIFNSDLLICYFSRNWKQENIIDYYSHHRYFLCYKHRSKKLQNDINIRQNYEKHAIKQIKKQKEFFLSVNKINELNELKLKNITLI